MNRDSFLQLVDKYLAGKTSAEEERLLYNYYDSFQESAVWDDELMGDRMITKQQGIKRLRKAIGVTPVKPIGFLLKRKQWMLAAALLVTITGTYLLWKLATDSLNKKHVLEVVTRLGERKEIKLSDGTTIWLEPGSRLHYPKSFTGNTREVNITGEAFFDVTKNPDRPFVIHTGTISTRVLGTSFAVKAYDSHIQEVSVVTGHVMVQPDNQLNDTSITVVPNQKASWNNEKKQLDKIQLPTTSYYAQRRFGKFIYQGEPVAAVIDDIQHQYNIQVSCNAATKARSFYGDFDIKQPASDILNILAAALNAQLIKEHTQNTYRLTGDHTITTRL